MSKKLRKSLTNKKIAGVLGGVGEYIGIDATIIRIAYGIFAVYRLRWAVLLYLIAWFIMEK